MEEIIKDVRRIRTKSTGASCNMRMFDHLEHVDAPGITDTLVLKVLTIFEH